MGDETTDDDVRAARQGDLEAMGRLMKRHEARLRQQVERLLGKELRGKVRPSDVLQSAFIAVIRGGFRGDTEGEFLAYARQCIQNDVRDRGRYFGADKRKDRPIARESELHDLVTPSADLTRKERIERVRRAIESLPEDYRTVITLRMIEGLGHEEISARMGRSESSTRSLVNRARIALIAALDRLDKHDGGSGGTS